MFKKIISKIRVSHQEKKLEQISARTLSFDMKAQPFIVSPISVSLHKKSEDVIFRDIAPGTYRLLVSSNIKNIFNKKNLYATFDISEVLKVQSKQFRLGLQAFSDDKGIFEYFESFLVGDNEYGVITLKIPRFIKYLRITLGSKDSLKDLGLGKIYFGNINSSLYKDSFPHTQQENDKDISYRAELSWENFELITDSQVEIAASSFYRNISQNNKKAIMLFKFYDASGNEIQDNVVDNLGFSSLYECYFKYIPNTDGEYTNIHTFVVPQNISSIELAQVEFDVVDDETVVFKDICVSYKNQDLPNILNVKDIELFSDSEVLIFDRDVLSGKTIELFADIQYRNSEALNKKGLFLLSFYNKNKKLIDIAPNNLLWIKKHSSFYKYLPDTGKESLKIYDCEIPEDVAYLRIGFTGFNLKSEESVKIKKLSLTYKNPKMEMAGIKNTFYMPPSSSEAEISILGWEESIDFNKPTVLGIMDEFTQGCFSADVNLIQPRTDNWYGLSEKYEPSLVFIESAWKGNSGNWQYRISKYSNKPGLEVAQLCSYSKQKSIPTVFWNKEDPVHHDRFMESAAAAEYIFTTDENMISSYQEKTGNQKVYALPFAAQPLLHKPNGLAGRRRKGCFAGSWYGNRHLEREEVIVWLLDSAQKYGLDIYDRNYALGHSPFPAKYQKNVIGSLPYLKLCEEYRQYRVFLNVNSVTSSPTMFSRRVFELMACGTPIVSTYSQGISELFESDAVWLVNSQEEAEHAIHTLMTDDQEWRRRSLAGIREIFQKHTYAHRLNYIFEKIGNDQNIVVSPKVLVLVFNNDSKDINWVNDFQKIQNYQNYEILLVNNSSDKVVNQSAIRQVEQKDLQKFLDSSNADLFGVVSSKAKYGSNYIVDLANAYIYEPSATVYSLLNRSCDIQINPFMYHKDDSLFGALFKDKAEFLNQVSKYLNNQPLNSCNAYMIDSDEFEMDERN